MSGSDLAGLSCDLKIEQSGDKVICLGMKDGISHREIIIPDGVTEIANYAFLDNEEIVRAIIPDSVQKIGEQAFQCCNALESIQLPKIMHGVWGTIVDVCPNLRSIALPYGITEIGDSAFSNNESMAEIIIPDTVTKISEAAFYDCDSLHTLYFSDHVTEINMTATFYSCRSLTSIRFPEHILFTSRGDNFGEHMFYNCTSLKNIIIGDQTFSFDPERFSRIAYYCLLDVNTEYSDAEMKAILIYCCDKNDTEKLLNIFRIDRSELERFSAKADRYF